MRLFFLSLFILFASSACSLTSPDREAGLNYSGAFANWFYPSLGISIETAAVQGALLEAHDDEALRVRLRELATAQSNLNHQFATVGIHPFWREHHPGIIEATRRFDAATALLRQDGASGPIESVVRNFKLEEDTLMQAIIGCYAQAAHCPTPSQ